MRIVSYISFDARRKCADVADVVRCDVFIGIQEPGLIYLISVTPPSYYFINAEKRMLSHICIHVIFIHTSLEAPPFSPFAMSSLTAPVNNGIDE
jgi:hypothetical protein